MLENDLSCLEYLLNLTSLSEKRSRIWEGVLWLFLLEYKLTRGSLAGGPMRENTPK